MELVVIDEDGIVQSICEQPVFGIIKDLAILGWNDKFRQSRPQVLFFFLSDHCFKIFAFFGDFKFSLLSMWKKLIVQMIGKDLLVVLSDSGKLSFLAFSFEMHRFVMLHILFEAVTIYLWVEFHGPPLLWHAMQTIFH